MGQYNVRFSPKRWRRHNKGHKNNVVLLHSWHLAAILIALSCHDVSKNAAVAFLPHKQRRINTMQHASIMSTSSRSAEELKSLTVKELREIVKQSSTERGVLSTLKRKQDLIDYLTAQTPVKTPQSLPEDFPEEFPKGEQELDAAAAAAPAAAAAAARTNPRMIAMPSMNEAVKKLQSPKERVFEQVYQRFPPLRPGPEEENLMMALKEQDQEEEEGEEEEYDPADFRQLYHPIYSNSQQADGRLIHSDMDIVFVGTASCTPGVTRGVSCTALRLNWKPRSTPQNIQKQQKQPTNSHHKKKPLHTVNPDTFQPGTWLFDCGECTQLQVQKTTAIKPSKINKIFLTHAHGDHSFGLPGLLCLMGQDRDQTTQSGPIEIYGPEGLRMWLRVAIRYSVSRIVPPYRVHELMDVPMAPEWNYNQRYGRYFYRPYSGNKNQRPLRWTPKGLAGEDPYSWITNANRMNLEPIRQYGELDGGRDIYPTWDHPRSSHDGAPVWHVLGSEDDDVQVFAAPMSHGIPCMGYVVEEQSRPGRLRNEYVEPIVKRNVDALKEAGFRVPMKAMAIVKNLPVGSAFTFPDGTVVRQEDAVEPPRKGRKVVICGDTADCRSLEVLGQGADVVIHEATNAFLPGIDRDTSLRNVTRDALVHGHSTPQLAGLFAKKIGAKRLLLNHFSARYKGDLSTESLSIMMRIERQAMDASGLNETQVAAAWDLMVLPIAQPVESQPVE